MPKHTILDGMIDLVGGSVRGHGFDPLFREILRHHKENPLKHKGEWASNFDKEWKKPPKLGEVTTFQECVSWTIYKNRKVRFSLFGRGCISGRDRNKLTCTYTVYGVPRKLLHTFVNRAVLRLASRKEEEEELDRRVRREHEIYQELMSQARSSGNSKFEEGC